MKIYSKPNKYKQSGGYGRWGVRTLISNNTSGGDVLSKDTNIS
jgi:hypothetical protein